MNNKKIFITFFCVLMTCLFHPLVKAHDTTHIHPLITDKIADLIRDTDINKAYKDIHELDPDKQEVQGMDQRLYWGTDFDAGITLDKEWLLNDQLSKFTQHDNVIDGVVYEDTPSSKVLNHFYHATSGDGLVIEAGFLNGEPSSVRAMTFFNNAINQMGLYTEEAKHAAFFEFGKALHHVEDMSSPAHVHNDPHLTWFEDEKDDYEGYFLPMKRLDGDAGVLAAMNNVATPIEVNNPLLDIWGVNIASSMVMQTHTMTTYQGMLQYPVADYSEFEIEFGDPILAIYKYTPLPDIDPHALDAQGNMVGGEFAEMFPCPNINDTDSNAVRCNKNNPA